MKLFTLFLLVSCVAGNGVTPVEKVIVMLTDLEKKCVEEGHAEQKNFDEYKENADAAIADKKTAIDNATTEIGNLEAAISANEATIDKTTTSKDKHTDQLNTLTEKLNDRRAQYKKSHGQFNETTRELTNALESIDKAISTLSGARNATQTNLLQVDAVREVSNIKIPRSSYAMTAFLSEMSRGDYDGKASYDNKSDKIVKLLRSLRADVVSQKADNDQSWRQLEGDMQGSMQDLEYNIEKHNTAIEEERALIGATETKKAQNEKDLKATQDQKKADEDTKKALENALSDRTAENTQIKETNKGEVTALNEAIKIIRNEGRIASLDSNGRTVRLYQTATSFLQLVTSHSKNIENRERAERVISLLSQEKHMGLLVSQIKMASTMKTGTNVFVKVIGMIEKMIAKLQKENAEDKKKHGEYEKIKEIQNKKLNDATAASERYTTEMKNLTSDIERLSEEMRDLEVSMDEMDHELHKAIIIRDDAHVLNTNVISDAQAAHKAITSAIQVLDAFYSKAKGNKVNYSTETKSSAKNANVGSQEEASGILGMLEVIQSDFKRTEDTTREIENEDEHQFQLLKNELISDIKFSHKTHRKKDNTRAEKEQQLSDADDNNDLERVKMGDAKDALQAAFEKYDAKAIGQSYEDRVAAREKEMESLRNALCILDKSGPVQTEGC